ncbi:MAG: hypothetical protein HXS53_10755 [Theionarchaea archaeon]|nr:hypothetical protein [Theionarchaea archaeon]
MTLARVCVYLIPALYVIRAFLFPERDIAVICGGLYAILVVSAMKKSVIAKISLFLFSSICLMDFLIYGVHASWLVLSGAGLILSYELIEFIIRHDVWVPDEQSHASLMKAHGRYLIMMIVSVVGLSLGVLFIFERMTVMFTENLYMNIVLFSAIFFGVLYLLRYVSR